MNKYFIWKNETEKNNNKVLDNFHNHYTALHNNKQDITLTICKTKASPTNAQHKYIHGVIVPLCKKGFYDLGYNLTTSSTYTSLKEATGFCKYKEIEIDKKIIVIKKYQTLSKKANIELAIEFIEKCIILADEWMGIKIPPPNKEWKKYKK